MTQRVHRFIVILSLGAMVASGCTGGTHSKSEGRDSQNETRPVAEVKSAPADNQETEKMKLETVTLGAGCFWCIEAVLLRVKGVEKVVSGYMGGDVANPTYKAVCTGETGHAEVVQVDFDPKILPLPQLLDLFWQLHDPTTLNRQGNDIGTQYRSAIFYHSDGQRDAAVTSKEKWDESGKFTAPIVTEIVPAVEFYQAEDYHQDFFNRNPGNPYCRAMIIPKFRKLGLLKEE